MEYSWREYLLRQARIHRMCTENREALALCSTKEEAIELYKKTIDWALEEDFPSIDILRRDFSGFENKGIFVDKTFHGELLCDQQVYVLHNCSGRFLVELNLKERIIPMIYLANGCDITIERARKGQRFPIRVPIYSFGSNSVIATSNDDIEFRLYEFDIK